MTLRWTHDYPHITTTLGRPVVRPTPQPRTERFPITARPLRSAFAVIACAVVGHDWTCRVYRELRWNPQGGDFTETTFRTPQRRRICRRCQCQQSRHPFGRWTESR